MSPITRRDFIVAGAAAGAGLVLGIYVPKGTRTARPFAPNAWLKVTPDNLVTLVVSKSEMGQGVRTSLAMIVAEELEADWTAVRVEQAPSNAALYGDQGTGGSESVKSMWSTLRRAGATGRAMLIAAAAERWGVLPSTCRAEKGTVVHESSGRRLTFGQLADAAARLPVPAGAPLKDPKDFRLVGTRIKRVDTPPKVEGAAIFGIDFSLPGMLFAAVARPRVLGGKVRSFEDKESRAIPGVRRILQLPTGVAVVAESVWAALEGRRLLEVVWDEGANAALNSAAIRSLFVESAAKGGHTWRDEGDPAAALRASARTVEAVYEVPFHAHATMEPMNCTAHVHDGRCEIWVPTQVPNDIQESVGKALGLSADAVTVNLTLLGGGFGRRLEEDYAVEAAEISKAASGPTKTIWTREEDMWHDWYRPASYHVMRGGVDSQGWPRVFMHHMAAPSIIARWVEDIPKTSRDRVVMGQTVFPYSVPSVRLEFSHVSTPVPVGFWRSVYASQVAFAHECFLDELAAAGRKDPLELRRRLLAADRDVVSGRATYKTARLRAVLELAAEKAGWGKPLPAGRFRGIACFPSFDTYVAQVAEVSVEEGAVRVHRAVCAIDCGQAVNPDTIEAQMQGGIVFGLSAALKGAITVENGGIKEGNFDEYDVMRMREAPEVEVHIVPSTEAPSGAGEPGVPPIAPAVANALFAATGRRLRTLPIRL